MPEPLNEADHDAYWHPLGQLLVQRGLLTNEELEAALNEQDRTGDLLGEILLRNGLLSRLALMSGLHEQALAEPADASFRSGLNARGSTEPSANEPEIEGGFGSGLRDALARHDEEG